MTEEITPERLDNYTEIIKEYNFLLKQKKRIIEKIKSLQGIDYSKIKVTKGNGHKNSEQETFVISLEKINKQLDEYKAWIWPEYNNIRAQIGRIKRWEYRKVLVYRYLLRKKWSQIIAEFFKFEEDFEDEKNNKYKDKILYWNRQALNELKEISTKPFIKAEKQLNFEINEVKNDR